MADQSSGSSNVFLTAIATLNPVLLLVVGYVLNTGLEQNRREVEKSKHELEKVTNEIANLKVAAETSAIALQQRIDKVKVIGDFLNDLSGGDERRRKLAIEAILIALPEEASRLVMVIEQFTKDGAGQSKDAVAARDALDAVRAKLAADMFSNVKATRVTTLSTLRRSWADDPLLVAALLKEAERELAEAAANGGKADEQGAASLYNVVVYFSSARAPSDQGLKERVRKFLVAVQSSGSPNTKTLAASTVSRFQ